MQNGQQGPRRCLLPHFKNRMMKPPNTVLAHACPIHLSHNVFAQRRQRAAVEHAAGSVPISSRLSPLCSRSAQPMQVQLPCVGPGGIIHVTVQSTTAAAEEECYNQCTNQLLLPCSAMLSEPSSATAAASQQPARRLAQHEKHCPRGTCNHPAHAEPPSAAPTPPRNRLTPPSPRTTPTSQQRPSLRQSAPPPAAAAAPGAC